MMQSVCVMNKSYGVAGSLHYDHNPTSLCCTRNTKLKKIQLFQDDTQKRVFLCHLKWSTTFNYNAKCIC